jgi:phosphoribosylanthranilate isomerase
MAAWTRIKICGITTVDDALCAVDAGADALGFVFHEKSPRYVKPLKVQRIVSALPPFVTTVGLFVNQPGEKIRQIMRLTGLQVVQLHGDEPPEACRLEPYQVIKALRVKDESSLTGAEDYPASALLLDTWSGKQYGGSGRCFDWQLARDLRTRVPLILAGGLTPENVAEAIRQVGPYGVDVSSGVEDSPGRKNRAKIFQFVNAVREL